MKMIKEEVCAVPSLGFCRITLRDLCHYLFWFWVLWTNGAKAQTITNGV